VIKYINKILDGSWLIYAYAPSISIPGTGRFRIQSPLIIMEGAKRKYIFKCSLNRKIDPIFVWGENRPNFDL
jgi:hypothetical protein